MRFCSSRRVPLSVGLIGMFQSQVMIFNLLPSFEYDVGGCNAFSGRYATKCFPRDIVFSSLCPNAVAARKTQADDKLRPSDTLVAH